MLERIQKANDIKKLAPEELPELAQVIRQFLIEKISRTGGHLASNLGVVELTMALHLAYNLPQDKLIWDVGQQSYTHKNLTGKNVDMNDGLFEVTLITNPKNPLELQEIMTALLTAEDNTDLIYSFKSAHVVIESEEAVPWTLDGEFGGDQTRVEIDNLHEAMHLYLTSSKKQKKSRLNQKMQEIKEITQKSEE